MTNGKENLFKEIDKSYDEIGELLKAQKLNTRDVLEGFLRTNRLIMAFFIGEFMEDHKKIEKIWPAYQIMTIVSSALGLSIIALIWALITGQAELIFK